MNINLSEHEADWLSKLLEVHECEMSDTILGKMNEAWCDDNMRQMIESCGDCDPCCGGRPDQCAVSQQPESYIKNDILVHKTGIQIETDGEEEFPKKGTLVEVLGYEKPGDWGLPRKGVVT